MKLEQKEKVCRNCNTQLPEQAKRCPSCGTKVRKPIYKRWWAILLAVVIVLAVIGSIPNNKAEKIDWDDIALSSHLPKPQSKKGEIIANSRERLSLYIHKTSYRAYQDYFSACESMGYTIDSEENGSSYDAFNEEGYRLSLYYNESDEIMSIGLEAPMEMGVLQWPSSDLAKTIPVPKSKVGVVSVESSSEVFVYVGETSVADYNAYVNACAEKGFTVDYQKSDKSYQAEDQNGNHLMVRYEGNQVMSIDLNENSEDTISAPSAEPSQETPEKPAKEETTASEAKGIRPEFQEAMDSYEAFMDEYCAFMKKYSNSDGTDVTLLADYAKYMEKYADMVHDFEAWDDEDLSLEETSYYIEVQSRVSQKLLEVSATV